MITRRGLDPRRLARYLGRFVLVLLAYDTAVTALYITGYRWVAINDLPLPLLGSAIAIIVTFRNNAAYNRWWEARGLWGQVTNNSRNLARALLTMSDDPALTVRLVRYQIAYVLALRSSLLGLKPREAIEAYVPPGAAGGFAAFANVPTGLQYAMADEIGAARRGGQLGELAAKAIDTILSDLANAQGGLERIKRTPLSRQYSQFPQVFVAIYCLLLPIGLVHDLGLLTPVGSTVIGFMFLSLDQIGRDLEDPFESRIHDVPMQAITRTIEIDLLQAIAADPVPGAVKEVNGVLW